MQMLGGGGLEMLNPGTLYKQATGFMSPTVEALSEQARFAVSAVSAIRFRLNRCKTAVKVSVTVQMTSSEEFLQHFGLRLAQLLAPATPIQAVQQAIRQTLCEATGLPQATAVHAPHVPQDQRQLELVFVHDCRSGSTAPV